MRRTRCVPRQSPFHLLTCNHGARSLAKSREGGQDTSKPACGPPSPMKWTSLSQPQLRFSVPTLPPPPHKRCQGTCNATETPRPCCGSTWRHSGRNQVIEVASVETDLGALLSLWVRVWTCGDFPDVSCDDPVADVVTPCAIVAQILSANWSRIIFEYKFEPFWGVGGEGNSVSTAVTVVKERSVSSQNDGRYLQLPTTGWSPPHFAIPPKRMRYKEGSRSSFQTQGHCRGH